ncbi:uncharacterized protein isoform X2 [Rhodnius prolixus]|uniref:uncharacterized protein isoform X2 n=1 Tax=Rhodnius prolixus TaxID=13249 RepID=UPI003D18F786
MPFLDSLITEDKEELHTILDEQYGILLRISCIYPRLNPEKRLKSIVHFSIFFFIFIFDIISKVISLILVSDNFDYIVKVVNGLLIMCIIMSCFVFYNVHRSKLTNLLTLMFDNSVQFDAVTDQFKKNRLNYNKKYNKTVFYTCLFYFTITDTIITIVIPLVDYFKNNRQEVYTKYGVSLNLPKLQWTPFGSDNYWNFTISCLNIAVAQIVHILIISFSVPLFYSLVEHVRLELDTLTYAINRLQDRAIILYEQLYDESVSSYELDNNPALLNCQVQCVKECIRKHQQIIRAVSDLNVLGGVALSFTSYATATLIAIAGISMIFGSGDTFMSGLAFGIAEIGIFFVICWCGEIISGAKNNFEKALYSINWYTVKDKDSARMLQIMLATAQQSRTLYFNKKLHVPANFELFATVD